jgi:hypothetical protein
VIEGGEPATSSSVFYWEAGYVRGDELPGDTIVQLARSQPSLSRANLRALANPPAREAGVRYISNDMGAMPIVLATLRSSHTDMLSMSLVSATCLARGHFVRWFGVVRNATQRNGWVSGSRKSKAV